MRNALGLLLATLLAGCGVSPTPHYDARFGDAVREARQRMILNPQAGTTAQAPTGLDGVAAREAIGRYQDQFKTPPPAVNVINIGGQIGGQGR